MTDRKFDMTKTATTVFFLLVTISSTFFAAISQKKVKQDGVRKYKFNSMWFFLSFLVALIVATFNIVGADYYNYIMIIENSERIIKNSLVESGFNGLAYVLYSVSKNPQAVYCIIKGVAVIVFYWGFYMVRYDVPIWMSVLCYFGLGYFYFFLLSMNLAASLMFLSLIYLMKKKTKQSILCLILACLVHSSCIILVLPYSYYFVFQGNKQKKLSTPKIALLIAGYFVAIIGSSAILNFAVMHIDAFAQYSVYGRYTSGGFGIMFIIRYVPIGYFIYRLYKSRCDTQVKNVAVVFGASQMLFAVLSYQYEILARMYEHFIVIQCVVIPSLFSCSNKSANARRWSFSLDELVWIIYILIFGIYDINTIINYDANGISHFQFFNPF